MKSLYLYFKLLFSDDEQLIGKWNQLSEGRFSGKYREALTKELNNRNYHYDGVKWGKSST